MIFNIFPSIGPKLTVVWFSSGSVPSLDPNRGRACEDLVYQHFYGQKKHNYETVNVSAVVYNLV